MTSALGIWGGEGNTKDKIREVLWILNCVCEPNVEKGGEGVKKKSENHADISCVPKGGLRRRPLVAAAVGPGVASAAASSSP